MCAVQRRVKPGALPNVPMAELRPPERERVPPAQRAEQREAAGLDARLASALASIGDLEQDGQLVEGTRDVLRRALEAAAEERAKHDRTKERLGRTEKRLTEIREEREKTVRELREHLGARSPTDRGADGARLSYRAFCTDKYLQERLGDFIFFDSMAAFDAYAALLDAYFPLDDITFSSGKQARREAPEIDQERTEREAAAHARAPRRARKRRLTKLHPRNALIFWLVVARTGLTIRRAACLFRISRWTGARYFVTMTEYQREILRREFPRLPAARIKELIPERFKQFAAESGVETHIGHILDGFEKQIECPSDDEVRAVCWSSYKHLYTAKWLLDMLPNGAMYDTFEAYGGSVTDPKLVELSGFLDSLEEGIDVMVDKGFLIQEMVERKGSICWMPPKMARGQEEATAEEDVETSAIARLRIFVEHGVLRIKEWGWFHGQQALRISQMHLHSDVAFIIAMLCNCRAVLVH